MTNEEILRKAVTEAYNRGYKEGVKDARGFVKDAFDLWEGLVEEDGKLTMKKSPDVPKSEDG